MWDLFVIRLQFAYNSMIIIGNLFVAWGYK